MYSGPTPGTTFFHSLRRFLESLRLPKSPGWRAFVILSAAFVSLSGSTPNGFLLTKSNGVNENEIDAALQQAAIEALGQRDGAIIVMDPQTGRIRALVNPEVAFGQAMMAGSTIKPFTALAALRSGLIEEKSRTVCPGRFKGLSFSAACVHDDHLPPFSPSQAIAYSCNYYFGTLGQRLGRDELLDTLRAFGFGQPIGHEWKERGILQPCEAGNNAKIRSVDQNRSTQADCNARAAMGESDHVQVTPIQLLTAYAALVNGGRLLEPQLATGNEFQSLERARVEIPPTYRAIITEGMRGAVQYGTAKSAHLDSLPLYLFGKTGTSLPLKGFRSNGWFVGFASEGVTDAASRIRLAVLVFIKNAHGSGAAVVAKPIFESFAGEINKTHRRDPEQVKGDPDQKLPDSAIRNPQSAIKVHLVHDNVTEELSLEDYVLGVLRAEGSMETEPEALKALAIAIRTYALKNRGRHARDGYDFCSTTHCQRFLTSRISSPRVSKGSDDDQALPDGRATATMITAIKATEGQILLDNRNQLVDAYFGASCGGETANIGTLWGSNAPPYLRGVRDEYCVSGAHATWSDVITRADLLRALQSDARTNVGSRLDNVIISKRDETGRAEFVTLEGKERKTVRGWDFKIIVGRVLGWNVLKSSRFEVSRAGSNFIFHGSGFGHGLGLCQEGAHVMAQRGTGYQRILEKYFPGTSVKKEDRVASRLSEAERTDLNAEEAKDSAKGTEESLCVPLRIPLRPLRLNASFDHRTPVWKADVLTGAQNLTSAIALAPTELVPLSKTAVYKYFVPAGLKADQRILAISSEHFRVTYPANIDRRDANFVLRTLETARADYLHRASAASIAVGDLPTLEIRLNESTGDLTARTGQPWWAAAATKGNRIELQPVAILKRRGVLTNTLRHELAHVVIDTASHDRAPRWLEEGFAIYLAGEGSMISRYMTRSAMGTAELEKRLARPDSQEQMRALYANAYSTVAGLVRTQGEASVWKKIAGS